jgi:transmembrane sensor
MNGSTSALLAEAARWFLRLEQSEATSETFVEWQRWLNAAPEHRRAYEQIEETVLRLGRIPAQPALPAADDVDRDAYQGDQPVSQWREALRIRSASDVAPRETSHGVARARRWLPATIAAGVALFAAGTGWFWEHFEHVARPEMYAYRTLPGERRTVELREGSRVTLDANSVLTVRLGPDERSLTLERGEAFFQVGKDPSRPFVVQAGTTRVKALGTAFNVRMSGDRTVVAVTEGEVEFVADVPLRNATSRLTAQVVAGEGLSYVDGGSLQTLSPREAPLATAWLKGRRQYRNEALRYVLADVDRYTGHKIRVADEATGDLRFTGTLNLEKSDAWLRGLSVALPVTMTREADGALIVTQK